jgi:hypothetical protein
MIGIFWMTPDLTGLFYCEKSSLEHACKYGDWLVSPHDHASVWEQLKSSKYLDFLPQKYRDEYWKLPRGRISYNIREHRYYIYHGNWLTKEHKKILLQEYEINDQNYIFEYDIHYTI